MTPAIERKSAEKCRYFVEEIKTNVMKTIFAILFIAMAAAGAQAQNAALPAGLDRLKSVMVYSEAEEAIVYKTANNNSKEILIESLPGYGSDDIPVEVNQDEKGSFTLKKHPSLLLPEFYTVVIKDTVTGEQFDLKDSDSYSFEVKKVVPERFLLQMKKTKSSLTAMK